MILFTVGTEQYPFNALMDWLDILIRYKLIGIDEEVIVQYGSSNKIPDGVKVFKRIPESKFRALVEQARIVVAHCGEGTAILLEALDKHYVLVPRSQRFGEHVDDHQMEMAKSLEKQGVPIAWTPADLVRLLADPKASSKLTFAESQLFCKKLSDYCNPKKYKKVMLVCSSGGHFKAMKILQQFWQQCEDISWVTFRTATTEADLTYKQQRVYWAYSPTNRNLPNLIRNLILAFKVLHNEQPDLVLSTGAGVAVPFLLLAKFICKSKVIFVESKTRLKKLSLSASMLQFLSALDLLVIQSQELASHYPNALYIDASSTRESIRPDDRINHNLICQCKNTAILRTPTSLNTQEAPEFVNSFQTLCQTFHRRIVLDMSATTDIDSIGIGVLLSSLKAAATMGSELVLWSLTPEAMSILSKTKFDRFFSIEAATKATRTYSDLLKYKLKTDSAVINPIQRAIDIIVAIIGLTITAVLFIPITLAIKLDSPGPIFSKQTRFGLMGKYFCIRQFRSSIAIKVETGSVENAIADKSVESKPASHITRVGRFLQKTNLNKLPLFWNLLVGDISFVGSRAPTINEVANYSISEWIALNHKPGITGEWQMSKNSLINSSTLIR